MVFSTALVDNSPPTLKNKSAKGKSLAFLLLIDCGYICSIAAKLLSGSFDWYVLFFYILNFCMVTTDMILYFYFKNKEKAAA